MPQALAPAGARRDEPGADPDQVGEYLAVSGLDLGPVRHRDDQVSGVGAGAVRALSRPAVAGPSNRPAVEVEQGGRAGIHLEDDVTAAAAVAAVRAAQRLELLPVNRGAAVSAVAGLHLQRDPVGELRHCHSSFSHRKGGPGSPARLRVYAVPGEPLLLRLGRDDTDRPATTELDETHSPADQREQRVVAAAADAIAGVEVRAAL